MKAFFLRVWEIILAWAKAEVAFLLPLLGEWLFDAVSRLAEQSGEVQLLALLVHSLLVWLTPNKPVS